METEFSKLSKNPSEVGGIETQTPYVILSVEEIDAHFENAKSSGPKLFSSLQNRTMAEKIIHAMI